MLARNVKNANNMEPLIDEKVLGIYLLIRIEVENSVKEIR